MSESISGVDGPDFVIAGVVDPVRLGRGSFGVVYRAFEPASGRLVAVNVLAGRLADERDEDRFDQEWRALGSLSEHPNIVTLHTGGVTDEGQRYLIMDYLADGSVANKGLTGWEDATRVGVKMAGALAAAHAAGIVHRDIKPANILMSAYGEPQLADFGLARLGAGGEVGALAGTLAHASPEIICGSPATAVADVWSLASTLVTLLTGRPPFSQEGDESATPMVRRILDEPPIDLRPLGIPGRLCEVIEAALAKDTWARTPTALALGQALQDAQQDLGVVVTPMVVPVFDADAGSAREGSSVDHGDAEQEREGEGEGEGAGAGAGAGAEADNGTALMVPFLLAGVRAASTAAPFHVPVAPVAPLAGPFFVPPAPPAPPGGAFNGWVDPRGPESYPTIIVRSGDNLWNLAQKYLGQGDRYREIWELNRDRLMPNGQPFSSPDRLQTGTVLTLPPHAVVPPSPVIYSSPAQRLAAAGRWLAGHVAAVAAVVIALVVIGLTVGFVAAHGSGAKTTASSNATTGGSTIGTDTGPTTSPPTTGRPATGRPTAMVIPSGIVGMPKAQALAQLARIGFAKVRVDASPDARIDAGDVSGVIPAAGSTWGLDRLVTLDISSGVSLTAVPNVVGRPAASAAAVLKQEGFTFTTVSEASPSVALGTVVAQDPPQGRREKAGDNVVLMVSSGPTATKSPVPQVTGQVLASAERALQTAGFTFATDLSESATVAKGTVVSQRPAAGKAASPGTKVELVVSTGPKTRPCLSEVGKTRPAAVSALAADGCTAVVQTAFSANVPIGEVIKESPAGPEPIGTVIHLVVSAGPPPPTHCPSVVGEAQGRALHNLGADGCTAVIQTAYNSDVPIGDVISENPPPPERRGTAVTLLVSKGPGIVVPEVQGDTTRAGEAALEADGLAFAIVTTLGTGTPGTVLSQNPPAQTVVAPHSTVTLTVSEGVTVPNVVGDTEGDAEDALKAADLGFTVVTVGRSGSSGIVLSQNPPAQTVVAPQSTVTLTVSDGVVVPDVVGRKLSAAEAILTNADLLYAVTVTFDASCSDEPIVISEPAEGTVVPEGTTIQLIVNAACDDRTSYLDA